MMAAHAEKVLTHVDKGIEFITLNRPNALNSLNQAMTDLLAETLSDWAHDGRVRAAVIGGVGERGLCTAGDVVAIYHGASATALEPAGSGSTSAGSTLRSAASSNRTWR